MRRNGRVTRRYRQPFPQFLWKAEEALSGLFPTSSECTNQLARGVDYPYLRSCYTPRSYGMSSSSAYARNLHTRAKSEIELRADLHQAGVQNGGRHLPHREAVVHRQDGVR